MEYVDERKGAGELIIKMDRRSLLGYEKLLFIILLSLTFFSMICKIFVGLDIDESYTVYLAYKLTGGDAPLKQVWDLYQTGAIVVAPFYLIRRLTDTSLDGLIIYIRICSAMLQLALAILYYVVLKKYYKTTTAFVSAMVIANMLPRATQSLEYGFVTIKLLLLVALLLFDIFKGNRRHLCIKLLFAGLAYGMAVFDYPTMIVTLPIILYYILRNLFPEQKGIGNLVTFMIPCIFLLVTVVTALLLYMPVDEIVHSITGMLMTGDHTSLFYFLNYPLRIIRSLARCGGLIGITLILFLPFRRKSNFLMLPYIFFGVMAVAVIIPNISHIRESGPFGLLERYVVLVIFSFIFMIKGRTDNISGLFTFLGIGCYTGALMGSNLGLNENAMYLEPAVVGCMVYACEGIDSKDNLMNVVLKRLLVFAMILEVIFSRFYFVRVDGTVPANLFESRARVLSGPAEGIFIYRDELERKERKADYIEKNTDKESTYTYIGYDSLMNFYFKGKTVAPQFAPTLSIGKQWIEYFDSSTAELPDYIFIDRAMYGTEEAFYHTEFGDHITGKYIVVDKTDDFIVIERSFSF